MNIRWLSYNVLYRYDGMLRHHEYPYPDGFEQVKAFADTLTARNRRFRIVLYGMNEKSVETWAWVSPTTFEQRQIFYSNPDPAAKWNRVAV